MMFLSISSALSALLLVLPSHVSAGVYPADVVDKLAVTGTANLKTFLAGKAKNNCTFENAIKRQEWSDLSLEDRQAYTKAVLCLQSKPPKVPSTTAPGARSRYDDFVALHIVSTLAIHGTANFLGWHRYFTWLYEQALRDECGYKGHQPYWNWDRYAKDPINSPIFNGNESSMSGNGLKVANPGGMFGIAPGVGGGCVTTGPFKNMTVNLGPLSATVNNVPANPQTNGLGYNPRCLRRDVNKNSAAATFANYTYSLITQSKTITTFQNTMQGSGGGTIGVHSGGHFTIGGDPGGDFYTSPGDPAFWLHHGMIDRVWWIWQMQDPATRLTACQGPATMMGTGTGSVTDVQDFGWVGPKVALGDLLDTMGGNGGKFCYYYV